MAVTDTLDGRSPEDILAVHPLPRWIAWRRKAGSEWQDEPDNGLPRDLLLSASCSSRFCISMEEGDALTLACADSDMEAISSVRWEMAAYRRGQDGRDHIILSCADVGEGIPDAPQGAPRAPLRVWIHLSPEMSAELAAVDPAPILLRVRRMVLHRGALLRSTKAPIAEFELVHM